MSNRDLPIHTKNQAIKKFEDEGFCVERDYPYWGLMHYTNPIRFTDKNALHAFIDYLNVDYPDIWWDADKNTTYFDNRNRERLIVVGVFSADHPDRLDPEFRKLGVEESQQRYEAKHGHRWVDPDED